LKFLILEHDPERINWFANNVFQHRVMFCLDAEDAIKALQRDNYDVIFLDHDLCDEHYKYVGVPLDANFEKFCNENLDATTGYAVARWLSENPNKSSDAQIIIHTMNRVQSKRMAQLLQSRNVYSIEFDDMKRIGRIPY
jgi:CheY-like chemotaxis protein